MNSLEPVDNDELRVVLNGFEVLADSRELPSDPMLVRVFRVVENGECAGTPESCPKSRLYIAVSEYAEYAGNSVFRLPDQHDWNFVGWKHVPEVLSPGEFMVLELSYQMPSPTPEKGWWDEHTVLVKVNPGQAFLVRDAPSN